MIYEKVERFKVGFNKRKDTYTQKLGFINPIVQEKTEKKKEKFKYANSYENWRDHKIPEELFENVPLSGFILNYKVGGHYYGWNEGREPKVRVLDPRGFEIEIRLENLVHLLEFGMGKGKLFESEMVYIYKNGHLTLLSTEENDYKELYNESRQELSYDGADFILGHIYCTGEIENESQHYMYLGQFEIFENVKTSNGRGKWSKKHLFSGINYSKGENPKVRLNSWGKTTSLVKSKIKFSWKDETIEIPKKDKIIRNFFGGIEDLTHFEIQQEYSYSRFSSGKTPKKISNISEKFDYLVSNHKLINFKPISELLELSGSKGYYYQTIKIFGKEYSERFHTIPDDKKDIQVKGYPSISFLISEYYKSGNKLQIAKFEKNTSGVSVLVWVDVDEKDIQNNVFNKFSQFKGKNILTKILQRNGETT